MAHERSELEFRVYHTLNVERLCEIMNARADRLCEFLLVLLGLAMMFSLGNSLWLGAAVMAIASIKFICRFGETTGAARVQKARYKWLRDRMSGLGDIELAEQVTCIEDQGGRVLPVTEEIASLKSRLMRGVAGDHPAPLSWRGRFLAYFFGGASFRPLAIPRREKSRNISDSKD